jgi:hypothetical protein
MGWIRGGPPGAFDVGWVVAEGPEGASLLVDGLDPGFFRAEEAAVSLSVVTVLPVPTSITEVAEPPMGPTTT